MKQQNFILIGAAGFVAPRHMAAIKAVGGELVAACDPHDAVGVLDRYFPRCEFYTSAVEMIIMFSQKADYAVVCSPNYLHAEQTLLALEHGMNVIIEKPAAMSAAAVTMMRQKAGEVGKTVNCILQMRLHHDAELMLAHERQRKGLSVVEIDYHTPRGPWYTKAWKSDPGKSGGLVFNIGVHLFDLALLAFGGCRKHKTKIDGNAAEGGLVLEHAEVRFDLSINGREKARKFRVNGIEYDFTNGFDDLHAESYRRILEGKGFTLEDALPAIALCERLSHAD